MSEIKLYCITSRKAAPAAPRAWIWKWKGELFFDCIGSNSDIWEKEPIEVGSKYYCWQSCCRVDSGSLVGKFSDPVLFDEKQGTLL